MKGELSELLLRELKVRLQSLNIFSLQGKSIANKFRNTFFGLVQSHKGVMLYKNHFWFPSEHSRTHVGLILPSKLG